MEIVEGIHRIDEASGNIAHSNVYLVINGKELTVVDTGTSGNAKKTVEYIQKLGYQPSDVAFVVLTHYHMDHVGSAKELKDLLPNAKVAVHEADAAYVSGKEPLPKPKNILFRAFSSVVKPVPVAVDLPVKDGEKISSFQVVHSPGHTPGSICLLDAQRKALFVGDAIRSDKGELSESPSNFNLDTNLARESIGKIANLNFEVLLPGHGPPVTRDAVAAVKKLYAAIRV